MTGYRNVLAAGAAGLALLMLGACGSDKTPMAAMTDDDDMESMMMEEEDTTRDGSTLDRAKITGLNPDNDDDLKEVFAPGVSFQRGVNPPGEAGTFGWWARDIGTIQSNSILSGSAADGKIDTVYFWTPSNKVCGNLRNTPCTLAAHYQNSGDEAKTVDYVGSALGIAHVGEGDKAKRGAFEADVELEVMFAANNGVGNLVGGGVENFVMDGDTEELLGDWEISSLSALFGDANKGAYTPQGPSGEKTEPTGITGWFDASGNQLGSSTETDRAIGLFSTTPK